METLIEYALQFVGTPYRWGGTNPLTGFDCSGFVRELLRAAGVIGPIQINAQGLYDLLDKQSGSSYNSFAPGAIAFYGADALHIDHVTFVLNPYQMIGACGGDHTTVDLTTAQTQGAYVKIRPIKYRQDFLFTVKPSYTSMGLI